MALCSRAFPPKRGNAFTPLNQRGPAPKRVCLSKLDLNASADQRSAKSSLEKSGNAFYSSSSDSLSDSEDQQSCYIADQIRAKRRASVRTSFSLNNKLSKAVSQYSDDDDQELESMAHPSSGAANDDNLDCKLSSSPSSSSIYLSNVNGNVQMLSRSGSTGNVIQMSDSCSSTASNKNSMPESDKISRARCFEYLVGAIDEAWARYCDAASYVEDEAFGYNTPASVATDDEEYFGNTTDLTDYESDTGKQAPSKPAFGRKPSIFGNAQQACYDSGSTDKDPSSCKLQALKDRLTKAKYFLQDLVDSDDYNESFAFWKRWDMVKYATIELVEDDDDDEVIESTIDELEDGRLFTN